jgi:hypothetical protein
MSAHQGNADIGTARIAAGCDGGARVRSSDPRLQRHERGLCADAGGNIEAELVASDRQHARAHRHELVAAPGQQREAGWCRTVRRWEHAARVFIGHRDRP